MVITISDLYQKSRHRLLEKEDPQMASLLARNLLCFVTGKSHAQILSEQCMYVGDETCDKMQLLVSRVLADEPLAYVLGE